MAAEFQAWPLVEPFDHSAAAWAGLELAPVTVARLSGPSGLHSRTCYSWRQGADRLVAFGQRRPGTGQEKLWGFTGQPELAAGLLEGIGRRLTDQGLIAAKLELPTPDPPVHRQHPPHSSPRSVPAAPVASGSIPADLTPPASPTSSGPVLSGSVPADPMAAALAAAALAQGYEPLPGPREGLVGVVPPGLDPPTAPTDPPTALARFWRRPSRSAGDYLRQSTPFTCGPAAALMALSALGRTGAGDRSHELSLWRQANSHPGCDPFGLAVALAGEGVSARVSVSYPDTYQKPAEAWLVELRDWFQRDFAARAQDLGLVVERRWVELAEVAAWLSEGALVLALIDEFPFHGRHTLHWILLYGLAGPDHVMVQDPWTQDEQGETWVDAQALPVTWAGLDRLTRFCPQSWRACLVLDGR
ncbi:MAG: peptidase C39 family protein [Propionibacteriaceae bacterium]|jgi:hypothetical protein|nr:peptidase C39 family protein [Propionibacteriaceae bacterium]